MVVGQVHLSEDREEETGRLVPNTFGSAEDTRSTAWFSLPAPSREQGLGVTARNHISERPVLAPWAASLLVVHAVDMRTCVCGCTHI